MKITTKFIAASAIVLGLIIFLISGSAFLIRRTEASLAASREQTRKTFDTVMKLELYLRDQVVSLKDFLLLDRDPLQMGQYQKEMSNFVITLDELERLMPHQNEEILVIRHRHEFLMRLAAGLTDTPSSVPEMQQDIRSINSFRQDIDLYLDALVAEAERQEQITLAKIAKFQKIYFLLYWGTIGTIFIILWLQYKLILQPVIRGITNLQQGARIIGDGNLTYRLNLKTDDEIEEVGHQFDLMGEQLAELYNSLEQKVAERTAELSEANEHLQTEICDRKQAQAELQQTLEKLQKAQAQLIQTEKMSGLGQMVAGVAHEINNPVSFIYSNIAPAKEYIRDLFGLLQLYQEQYPEPTEEIEAEIEAIDLDFILEDLPKILNSMKFGAERISEIVKSLRTFARLQEAELKLINLHESLESTLIILKHRLKSQGNRPTIEIIKEYGEVPQVECYAGQLNQVFMNLLNNAIDAFEMASDPSDTLISSTPSTPKIYLRSWVSDSNHVKIQIADNGCGMSEAVREKIFDPFFTTKPVGKGTGLGLSTSYQIIVDRHDGELECVSTPGKGTEFMIKIPIRRKPALRNRVSLVNSRFISKPYPEKTGFLA